MISAENRKLIDGIKAPEEHAELVSAIVDACRQYVRQKNYYPFVVGPAVEKDKYFCAYKQGASGRGQGAAIIGFENRGEGLCLVFHHVVFDAKRLIVQTEDDKKNGWRRIHLNRAFLEDVTFPP